MVKSFCFTGLFLWLYLFHCYCKNFHLGLLMQRGLRNFASYEMQASAISIAVDNARQDGHFRNHTFSVTTRFVDKESQSAGVAVEMITKGKIDLLLGHPSSKRNIGPAYVTPYFNIPHITWEAKDPTMSQKHIFTTLIRLSSVYNKIGLATSALFRQFGWNRAAILADESYALCTHAVNGFLTETTAKKIVIASYQKFNAPSSVEIDTYLHVVKTSARIVFLCGSPDTYRTVMLRAYLSGMCDGYYVFLDPIFYQSNNPYEYKTWFKNNSDDMISREAFRHVIHFRPAWWFDNSSEIRHRKMMEEVPLRMSLPPWNDSTAIDEGLNPTISAAILHDSMYLAVLWWDYADAHGLDHKNGTGLLEFTHTVYFNGTSGKIRFDGNGDKQPMFWLEDMKDTGDNKRIFGIIELFKPKEEMFTLWQDAKWLTADGLPPPSTPLCGFANELCPAKATDQARFLSIIISVSAIVIITVVIIVMWISYMVASRVYWWRREPGYNVPRDTIDLPHVNWLTFSHNVRKRKNEEEILKMTWKVNFKDVFIMKSKRGIGSQLSRSVVSLGPLNEDGFYNPSYTTTARYKGQTVALRKSQRDSVHLTIQNLAELKTMKDILHPNINPFVGACIEPPDIYCLFLYGSKGSLQDVLENDDIKLNWAFQVSVLKDIASGMKFLQSTILKSHGRLKSPNCIIDNRWVVKLTDYGISEFCEERKFEEIDRMEDFKDLLWTAPELLRSNMQGLRNGTKQGDVYSYGIIMHEIFYRCGTFPLGGSTPKEIVEQVKNPTSRIIRPALVLSADIKSPMVNLMQQCWNETSTERPEFAEILQVIKVNNKEACISFVDSMINMLESYANNLEDLVEERTNALNDEKEKTDLLLYRMLPRPVADRLKRGETVNPEQFTQVTIYFSDIVGFTSIAARITPLEVVDFLNEVYTLFDDIIEIFDVYKVETIGDAYMVVSGLPIRNGNIHSAEIAKLALTIIRNLTSFKMKALPNQTVMVRIGIHTGPVCAGVVGQTMPRYCLFGDTVNTASRMESNGEGGKIHITKSTRDALSLIGGFEISERGFISIKGKGELLTYWLEGSERV